jgi:NADH-quinone oxidoreductase subunit H
MIAPLLAVDPLLDTTDWWWKVLVLIAFKVVIIFVAGLVGTMLMVWFERKIVSGMQNRVGPNKAGPFGLLQTLADGTKLFFKEDLLPEQADKWVFRLAPFLAFVPAFLLWAVIPLGGDFSDGKDGIVTIPGFDLQTRVQLVDPPIGILVVLALSSIGVYGIMLAGWASGSKYPLLGSVRASAQLLSYEAAFGLSIVAVLLHSGTLSTRGIANAQSWTSWHSFVSDWYWSVGIVSFVIFLIAAVAETNHPPFDFAEAEQELVGGFHTEYTGIRFAIFFLAEFMNVITMSAIAVTLFLGGPSGPALGFLPADGTVNVWIMPIFWFFAKLLVLLFGTVWLRASLPRLRYDQLMAFGWKVLLPLSLLNLLLAAGVTAWRAAL